MNGFDETLLHSSSESVFFFFLSRSPLALHMVADILCTYIFATAMPREWTNNAATIAERESPREKLVGLQVGVSDWRAKDRHQLLLCLSLSFGFLSGLVCPSDGYHEKT